MKKIAIIGLILIIILGAIVAFTATSDNNLQDLEKSNLDNITENGHYNSKEDVAAYIHKFHKLPSNYITKKEAKSLGWSGGSLSKIAPGKSIGGDVFTNRQKILPEGHRYIECDIDTDGKDTRGNERIVYSADDFKIYYTDDHYSTFTEIRVGD